MEREKGKIEAILFASGRVVKRTEFIKLLEVTEKQFDDIMNELIEDYKKPERGIEIVMLNEGYQLASKQEYYEDIVAVLDNRMKANLSNAALEVLAIIAYNKRVTRNDIDTIRGVDSSGSLYKLMDYNLVETDGKLDLPGKPMSYKVTEEFFKMFGIKNINDLPSLPKFKLDSNRQIIIEDLEEDKANDDADNDVTLKEDENS